MTRSLLCRALVVTTAAGSLITPAAQAAQPAQAAPQRVVLPVLTIGDTAVVEGSTGARTARFTVTLSATSATQVTAHYATLDGTATTGGADYTAASGTVTIPAGALSATVNVNVRGDTTTEPAESYRVRLTAPSGATVGRASGTGRIVNDDPPLTGLRVAAGDASITEGNGGSRNATVSVTLSSPAPAALTVDWSTIAGTATAATDFTTRSGRLSFATGATTAYVTVPVLGDTQFEPTETVAVKLATPTGGARIARAGTISITNDDAEPPVSPVGKLSAGTLHTCAVVAGGAVKCWGFNTDGQLGNGTYNTAYAPTTVTGLTGATAVAAGHGHTCALMSDTTVKCWGINENLELGLGIDTQTERATDRLSPVAVPGLTGVVSIDAGSHHTCAIVTGGTVKCWGEGYGGRLGNGGSGDIASPTTVAGWAGAVQISAGREHTCARWADGTVKCSGYNFNGELGDGSRTDRMTPVSVTGITGASSVVTGYFHTCVIVSGAPRCFGYNFEGALGDGTQEMRLTPVPMTGVTSAANISLGQDHTCVTLTSGAARCVGFNGFEGRLGNNDTVDTLTTVPVSELSGGTVIESGTYHTCAVVTGNAVKCWGADAAGQLGNGTGAGTLKPVTVTGVTIG
ncbi:hypothetical protein F0U44_10470 [Nocardioides humilatus]|uniref:Calx-beta domain-containing protein n=1 Tax=Nocardioides humilatus TaxID=2607660 RepID=A0A5B1LDT7_9ACTN|nr:Calx-beta domain-containing protein [Nocardioides humilatus]KAA1418893.1 hypothetical protein F0U44_10470 [Nocardioides humilatus]